VPKLSTAEPATSDIASDDKRTAIVAAAIPVFATEGFEKARIADIAAAARVGKGTVYEYFRSKEELLLAACIAACQRYQAEVESVIGPLSGTMPPDASPAKIMHTLLKTLMQIVLTKTVADIRIYLDITSVSREQPAFLQQARTQIEKMYASWESAFALLYECGVSRGEFRKLPVPSMLARTFSAFLDGLIWQQAWRSDIPPHELASQASDMYIHLLLVDPDRLPSIVR
jgi:AcrR family transcriptional regulator